MRMGTITMKKYHGLGNDYLVLDPNRNGLCLQKRKVEMLCRFRSESQQDEIVSKVRRGEIEDWELEGSRRTLIGACMSTLDEQGRQEDFWLGQTAAGLEEGPEEFAARLEGVTREQVAASARKLELDTVYFLKGKED